MTETTRLSRFESRLESEQPGYALGQYIENLRCPLEIHRHSLCNMALVGSQLLADELAYCTTVHRLFPDNWQDQLSSMEIDFLLVESSWFEGEPEGWRSAYLDLSGANPLLALLAYCDQQDIPCVFWHTAECSDIEHFKLVAERFDQIYGANEAICAEYRTLFPNKLVQVLLPAISPEYANPIHGEASGLLPGLNRLAVNFDGGARLLYEDASGQLKAVLNQFSDYMLGIYESGRQIRFGSPYDDRVDLTLKRKSLGSVDYIGAMNIRRYSKASLLLSDGQNDLSVKTYKQALEILGCKSLLLTDMVFPEALSAYSVFGENGSELRSKFDDYLTNPYGSMALTHLGWREVMQHHTYACRIKQILSDLGRQSKVPLLPKISCVVPSVRPFLLPYVVEWFQSQTYENKELVIVLNIDDYDPNLKQALLSKVPNLKFKQLPGHLNIGTVLNVGMDLADGDYIAKWDDDDYYGPEYLSDAALYLSTFEIDIYGKACPFTYFEQDKSLWLRKNDYLVDTPHLSAMGGTIIAKRGLYYEENAQGMVDKFFLLNNACRDGKKLFCGDSFHYLYIRNDDKQFHTWSVSEEDLHLRQCLARELDLSWVNI